MDKQVNLILMLEAQKILVELCNKHPEYAPIIAKIHITISGKLTRSAGKAYMAFKEIILSSHFYSVKENFDKNFKSTVIHEVAHIVADNIYGTCCGHSTLWRNIDIRLGGTGEQYHQMSRINITYNCECGAVLGIKKKHTKELHRYSCRKCRKPLVQENLKYKEYINVSDYV